MSWGAERQDIIRQLDSMPYDKADIIAKEDANWELFLKHTDKVIPFFYGENCHLEIFEYAFGRGYTAVGVLDIGTGVGVFLERHLTRCFLPPRIGVDVIHPTVPEKGWFELALEGSDVLKHFGENSFDHVQCIETLEHVGNDVAMDIAEQMLKVSRKTCLITSMGLGHHVGDATVKALGKNPFLDYKGQPNIEDLMKLGYNVRLVGNYQVLAWYCK